MPELALPQRSEEWLAARKGKITASIAAACLGLDPYQGPFSAFHEITGRHKQPDNRHMAWGREFEQQARTAYESLSGHFVTETGFWIHPLFSWLGASPDGLIGTAGLVEIKCPGTLPTDIPVHHLIQMQVQLACTERSWCDYFAWSQEGEFCRRVEYEEGPVDHLLRRLEAFWKNHISVDMVPPRRRPKEDPVV